MTSLLNPVRKGAALSASVLESAASVLRLLADEDRVERPSPEPPTERAPTPTPRGTKPASGTRSRIANPKAARKVRSRQG